MVVGGLAFNSAGNYKFTVEMINFQKIPKDANNNTNPLK
jgi:hypothetical protein